ncbi:MAG: hypothetical protein KDC53_06905 [Saprospiraceae bacterium]|nr:hypothetical protein [Saprospiraceae bacterium]
MLAFYTIWFSQRNGSTLLCKGLESSKVLGHPGEIFNLNGSKSLISKYEAKDYSHLQEIIYRLGSGSNGVFGIKTNAPKKEDDPIINELKLLPVVKDNSPSGNISNFAVWEKIFPNGKHIFLTRRNKVRQAVSWWKAIVTNEWHRKQGDSPKLPIENISGKYDFAAIKHLLIEISMRRALKYSV